jgi:phosphatidate cytidylyltransferase
MNDILVRSISGAVFVFTVITALYWGAHTTAVLFLLIYSIGLIEFYKLFKEQPSLCLSKNTATFLGTLFFFFLLWPFVLHLPNHFILLSLLVFPFMMINELYREDKSPIVNIGIYFLGWLYLALPLFLIFFINFSKGWQFAIGLFVIVWTNDTFAYLSGRFLGKHKLFERISPNKTWEGTIGGVLFAMLAAFLWASYFDLDVLFWLLAGTIIAVGAVFGDLIQSMFKRSVNVKDTGTIMPGHGGVLDRFDAVLFVAPVFFVLIYFFYN